MCLWAVKHHGPGVHIVHFIVNIAHFVVKRHRSGLAGLMVLKGIVFGLFFPFLHWMVLKGGAVMTYGLRMSSSSFCRLCHWGPGSCKIVHI